MSRQLIESIVAGDMLEASDVVNDKLDEIRACKMYEAKRRFASEMNEGIGGLTKAEIEARKKAGYRKASEVLGDPRKSDTSPRLNPAAKIVKKKISEDSLDEAGLGDAVKAVRAMGPVARKAFRSAMRLKRWGSKTQDQTKSAGPSQTKTTQSDEPKSSSQTTTDAAPKSWEKDMADRMDRNSAMRQKRADFLKNNPGWAARAAITNVARNPGVKKLASDLSDIATSHLE